MAEHEKQKAAITSFMAAVFCRCNQTLDFELSQVFSLLDHFVQSSIQNKRRNPAPYRQRIPPHWTKGFILSLVSRAFCKPAIDV
jgi:hypothetical protein